MRIDSAVFITGRLDRAKITFLTKPKITPPPLLHLKQKKDIGSFVLQGTFSCPCKKGYKKDDEGKCKDIDECITGEAKCPKNSVCINAEVRIS